MEAGPLMMRARSSQRMAVYMPGGLHVPIISSWKYMGFCTYNRNAAVQKYLTAVGSDVLLHFTVLCTID